MSSAKASSPKSASPPTSSTIDTTSVEESWLQIVERQVQELKYGSVQVTVHEGHVVQIETTVKVRFDKPR